MARSYPTDEEFDPNTQKTQWQRFEHFLRQMNAESPNVSYKMLYVIRHGQGWHNVKEHAVGTAEWEVRCTKFWLFRC